jgi:hypothetical protein
MYKKLLSAKPSLMYISGLFAGHDDICILLHHLDGGFSGPGRAGGLPAECCGRCPILHPVVSGTIPVQSSLGKFPGFFFFFLISGIVLNQNK